MTGNLQPRAWSGAPRSAALDALPEPVPLEAVLRTDDLSRLPARPPDHASESRALSALRERLERRDDTLLHGLVAQALTLCRAHSAGLSLLEPDETGRKRFRWPAVAGRWAARQGGAISRDHSPCGTVVDRDEALIMVHPERHYGALLDPPVFEGLLVPVRIPDRAVGALWVLLHDGSRRFDGEDLRLLTELSRFASLALQVVERDRLRARLASRSAIDHHRAVELTAMHRLQELSERLIPAGDEVTLFQHVIETAREIMRADFATMQTYEPERDALRLLAQRGFEPAAAAAWLWVKPTGLSTCGMSLKTRRRVTIPDIESSAELAGSAELELIRAAGIRAMQSTPLRSRNGQLVGMLSTHWTRPTEPSEHELRLLDVLARQAADLVERTQGEQALREADRRKSEFLAMLAHELRNPLASIHNSLEVVRRASDGGDAHEACAIMGRQVSQLGRLVDDLLDINRISRGKIELRPEPVELAAVVNQAVETVAPLASQFEQTLSIELPRDPILLHGDPARLAQVFANLLHNACKYSERGGRIRLSARATRRRPGERPEPGESGGRGAPGEVVVSVQDEGLGIAADQLGRIFEMFAQVDGSLERSQGGLGIGLTLVKSLVEKHGGRVEARSEGLGKGSEFLVHLPLVRALSGAGDEAATDGAAAGAGRSAARRILVVDDDRDSADSLAMLLRAAGHETATAYGGEEALELAARFRPDVVLLDLGMPHVNGHETCRRLRAAPWGRDMLVIAQTGWAHAEDKALTEAAGFHGHLIKPVNLHDLARLLAELTEVQET